MIAQLTWVSASDKLCFANDLYQLYVVTFCSLAIIVAILMYVKQIGISVLAVIFMLFCPILSNMYIQFSSVYW